MPSIINKTTDCLLNSIYSWAFAEICGKIYRVKLKSRFVSISRYSEIHLYWSLTYRPWKQFRWHDMFWRPPSLVHSGSITSVFVVKIYAPNRPPSPSHKCMYFDKIVRHISTYNGAKGIWWWQDWNKNRITYFF